MAEIRLNRACETLNCNRLKYICKLAIKVLDKSALSVSCIVRTMDKSQQHSNTELVTLAREGQRPAIGKLYKVYQPRIHNLAFAILENHDDAEDICQDTFVKVVSSIDGLSHPECFEAWIDTIARNLSLKMLKNK